MSLGVDMENVVSDSRTASNFSFHLLKLIRKADRHNRELLRIAFPNAVKVYEHWLEHGTIIDMEYD